MFDIAMPSLAIPALAEVLLVLWMEIVSQLVGRRHCGWLRRS